LRGLLAIALLPAVVPTASADSPERALDTVVIQIPNAYRFEHAGYIAALEQGYYRAEGLDVRFRVERPLQSTVQAVVAGEAQYGSAGADLVQERLSGAPVVVLAAIAQHSDQALVVRGDSGIDDPGDLRGRRVVIDGTHQDAAIIAMLRTAGVRLGDLRRPAGVWTTADVAERRIDALAASTTTAPEELRAAGANPVVLRPSAYGFDFYGDALFTTEAEIRDHPERVEAVRRATLLGWTYALRHPDEVVDVLRLEYGAALAGLRREDLLHEANAMRELVLPDVIEVGSIDEARYQQMADALVDLGMAPRADLTGFVYEVPDAEGSSVARWVELAALFGAGAILLGCVIALWNMRLRSLVRSRTQELARSEAMYRLLAENDSDVTARHDPAGHFRYVSPSARQVLGYEPADLLGTRAADLVHPDDRDSQRDLGRVMTTDGPVVATYRLRRVDGSYIWVETAARRVLDAHGVVSEIQTSTRDISQRRAAEEELRRHEAQLSSLTRMMPAAMWAADADGVVTFVTPRWQEITGQPAEQAVATGWLEVIHPNDRERVREQWRRMVVDGAELRAEYRVDRRGETRWMGEFGTPVRDEAGVVTSFVGTTHDVTDARLAGERLEARAAQQAAVAFLGVRALNGDNSLPELLKSAARSVAETLAVDVVQVLAGDARSGGLRCVAQVGLEEDIGPILLEGGGDFELELLRRIPGVVDGRSVPIRTQAGAFGILAAHSRGPRPFSADDLNHLQSVANVLAGAIERDHAEQELQHQALHDALTGLPNRTLLRERLDDALARAAANGTSVGVLFLDLDHFKVINDSAGHAAGDELLLAVAERLRAVLRPGDTAARFGGDEFVILCEDLQDEADATAIAGRVVERMRPPFAIAADEVVARASVGVAIVRGSADPDAVLRDSDAALYRAKSLGRDRFEVFDETMRADAVERLQLEGGLRRAVEREEFGLLFQPIVSLIDGKVRGFEALLRWHHPERGVLAPGDFIDVAEETSLIQPIGRWVLGEACRQAAAFNAARPDERPLRVSVNLSARQVSQPEFAAVVRASLEEYGLDPSQLWLEITESVLIEDSGPASTTLKELAEMGCPLVLDDFGTGYSSLGYLRRFPLAALKLDRSFVAGLGRDPDLSAIVAAVAGMARALRLDMVAEGVETHDQAMALLGLACPLAQGFHYARPLEPADALALITGPLPWRSAADASWRHL
jgi:diguanylate cyclase (GGDEF)-like protein/PAS domain S-box-containing protein